MVNKTLISLGRDYGIDECFYYGALTVIRNEKNKYGQNIWTKTVNDDSCREKKVDHFFFFKEKEARLGDIHSHDDEVLWCVC
jgi:hypothetical protein